MNLGDLILELFLELSLPDEEKSVERVDALVRKLNELK